MYLILSLELLTLVVQLLHLWKKQGNSESYGYIFLFVCCFYYGMTLMIFIDHWLFWERPLIALEATSLFGIWVYASHIELLSF